MIRHILDTPNDQGLSATTITSSEHALGIGRVFLFQRSASSDELEMISVDLPSEGSECWNEHLASHREL